MPDGYLRRTLHEDIYVLVVLEGLRGGEHFLTVGYFGFLREDSLFPGWGAENNGNRYNSRKSPYLRKIFFTCPFIFPKESKIIDVQKIFAPLNDAAKNFRPPFATPRKIFAPPKTKKYMCPKCLKNNKKCLLRTFGKK